MRRSYRIIDRKDNKKLTEYFIENGQLLMPMVELIEASRLAIDVLGRASIEAVLQLSAMSVAGEKHQGSKGGPIGWHGTQPGTVKLSERKVRLRFFCPPLSPRVNISYFNPQSRRCCPTLTCCSMPARLESVN